VLFLRTIDSLIQAALARAKDARHGIFGLIPVFCVDP